MIEFIIVTILSISVGAIFGNCAIKIFGFCNSDEQVRKIRSKISNLETIKEE